MYLCMKFIFVICRYPQYKFVSNRDIASSAGLKTRYTTDSLYGVIFDVMTLAESDYVVCTFSSQVRPSRQVPMGVYKKGHNYRYVHNAAA